MELEVCLVLDVLNKIFELSFTKFFVHGKFLGLLVYMSLELIFDNFPELYYQFQNTHLHEKIQKRFIPFKEGDNDIFCQEVIEGLLFDCFLHYLFGLEFIMEGVGYFEGFRVKLDGYFKWILEHIVRSVHLERYQGQFLNFGINIAREIEVSQFEFIIFVVSTVQSDFNLQFKFVYQFVRNVLFCGTVIKKFCKEGLELKTTLFFQLLQTLSQFFLEFIKTGYS